MIRTTTILLLAAVFSTSGLYAQDQGQLTGKVTDVQGEAIPGISVILKGSRRGVATDVQGNYTILNIASGSHQVLVSGVGLASQEVSVSIQAGQTTQQDFVMQQDATQMEEVVIQAESEAE
ncbi:MAG: carboxypeptidase-like regulatory domain-containing protein, partial [Cyclobacteriaceae bacterium]